VDAGRELAAQISDLGQVIKKMQKENDALDQQLASLRTALEAQQTANARLTGANEELKIENQKMKKTIETLASNKDSLAGQYMALKTEKEKLDDYSSAIQLINTRVIDENTEDGIRYGKTQVYLSKVLIGTLEWRLPSALKQGESRACEAAFSAESIDYIKATPEEKLILRSLGDTLRMRIQLIAAGESIQITSSPDKAVQEIGERDRSKWEWTITNQGTQDSRILLAVHLINRHSGAIPVSMQDFALVNSNVVRQIRSYIKPVPLAAGIVIGFLLFGIVSLFRRNKTPKQLPPPSIHNSTKEL
jgi:regulator of replication initiation timing